MIKNNSSSTLIFLPGWGFCASMWSHIRDILMLNHSLRTVFLIELSEALLFQPLPEDSILIGWSLGGLIALKHCLLYPNRYKKLILINSTPYFSTFTTYYKNMAENDFSQFKTLFLRWVFYPYRLEHTSSWKNHLSIDDETILLKQLEFLFKTDLRETYANALLPTLLIAGNRDAIVLPSNNQLHTSNLIVKTLRGGHALPFTHSLELSKILESFL